jgi:DNA-binding SARP family transcriptional activator
LLSVRLLGGLSVTLDGRVLPPLESARAESLLAYLVAHRGMALPRERVAFALWPDSREPQARTNLPHLLHTLRRALPDVDRFLDVTPRTLRWRDDESFELDVDAFKAAVARSRDDERGDALREAVGLYGGDLVAGSYDEWVLEERALLRQLFVDTLERLATLLEERHEVAEALGCAERLLHLDPLRERTYRQLMRLHDAGGDRARAIRVTTRARQR